MNPREQLVVANRILAHEGILDAFGHVSIRHPERSDRFVLAWARAPELVEDDDLLEFTLEGEPVQETDRVPYLERFIHGALYEARPDVMAVCHNHTTSILPFGISKTTRLRPVIHTGAVLGGEVPVWDIADDFGHDTNLLVVNMKQGRSLARTVGDGPLALMRGHGSVVAAATVPAVVSLCLNMDKNARVQLLAQQLGDYAPLAAGETRRESLQPEREWGPHNTRPLPDRAWEALVRRVGFDAS
ncbi:MAG: class II aldolase/adducin family protein [Chloroflexota bacterium]